MTFDETKGHVPLWIGQAHWEIFEAAGMDMAQFRLYPRLPIDECKLVAVPVTDGGE